jgi:phage/conjugal plasmid C-4 type zinc finger TraR family protein
MPDLFDHASGIETQFTEMALANQLARAKSRANQQSQTHCRDCGEEIPLARRKAQRGCLYCIECQQARE